jgi:cysteine desulfurase family protein (TIGR01976 family)
VNTREIRAQFPALTRWPEFLFFDNAAGAQVPQRVLDAVQDHLVARNVQRGGVYRHSREVDAMIGRAREAVAAFVHARAPEEIAFGLNATSFIRAISLAVGLTLEDRPEIVVTDLDHEANVATWLALERAGARIVWWGVRDDGRLHVDDLAAIVGRRTRLVACTVASNATGSLTDVTAAGRVAHTAGAEILLDAVHYAPHGVIDVQAFDCDYLVCSGYKIFAPHMGFAWCRRESIAGLPMFREHFIPDKSPDKLEAGTFVYENVAGMAAAVDYIESLDPARAGGGPRAAAIQRAMRTIADYERALGASLIDAIRAVPGATVHGVTDRARLAERLPTVSFTVDGLTTSAIAEALAARDIGVRAGHMYSPRVMTRLGLMPGGTVRASLVHYNSADEVARFGAALQEIVRDAR